MRAIGLAALGCLAGLLLRRMLQDQPEAKPYGEAQTIAQSSGNRIWMPPERDNHPALTPVHPEAVRSVLNIPKPMQFGSFLWNEDRVPDGRVWIRIDLSHQFLSVFRGGHEIGSAVILYGAEGKPTPIGTFRILQKDADHFSRTYDAPMPYMLRLTDDGVAIHGSSVRKGWATHGCIGVPMEFARHLFAITKKGDLVEILPDQAPASKADASSGYNRNKGFR